MKTLRYAFGVTISVFFLGCGRANVTPDSTGQTPNTTNGATNTTDSTSKSPLSFVVASRDAKQMIPATTTVNPILYDKVWADTLKEYDPATGRFTPKNPGLYLVQAQVGVASTVAWKQGDYCEIYISKSDNSILGLNYQQMTGPSTLPCVATVSVVVGILQGESIIAGAIAAPQNETIAGSNSPYTRLTITKISQE